MLIGSTLLQMHLDPPIREREVERLARDLRVAERLLAEVSVSEDPSALTQEVARLLDARVTLVAADGSVLSDTGVPGGDVTGMENHAGRPEVARALQGERVLLERSSPTAGVPSLYAAVMILPDEVPVVLRLARPLSGLPAPGRRGVVLLAGLSIAGLLAIALGSRWVVRPIEREIGAIALGVRRMSDGDFGAGAGSEPQAPELFEVSAALRELREEVRGRLREMQGQRDEMQTLIDSIAEGVIALTPDARVLRMNRAAAGLLDISAPAPFAPIGTLVRHPLLRDHLEEAVLMPLAPRELALGSRSLLISTHLLAEGGAVVTFLDVTELRRMEKIRRDFVANASHELKTPLTAMRGFAETLLEGDPPDDLKEQFLSSIRFNTVRLQHLVDDLLDLSRLESGAWQTLEEEVEVAALASEVWHDLSGHQRERDLDFRVEGDAVALADGQALEQIFRNLLDNAVRFTPDGGQVRVRIEEVGPELRVSVSDSGSGIPSSALPRIFERFYRVDPGRDRAAGGTGLGLAIVRHLVHSMGGEVSAESELGRGTTISFTLPRVDVD
jgi:two-component system, OmpR family, phosphate regulon sensor histidine kinase PhoR